MGAWSDFLVRPAAACRKIEVDNGQSETLHLGIFGPAGVTAYYGLVDIGQVTSKDTIIVSGAAGAVGSAAVQIAKHIIGCKRVIGIAGDDVKCRWAESLGADTCLNYKSDTFEEDLKEATRGFVNVIYDNVGGKLLDLMLARVAKFGRLIACGLTAGYNTPEMGVVKNWYQIIAMRVKLSGFVVLDLDADRWKEIVVNLGKAVAEGKLKADASGETIVATRFEDVPQTWMELFSGSARGKLISRIES
ncbi:NAD(P)-binding protein [Sarocladium strictum]